MQQRQRNPIGLHANAWSAADTGAGGTSGPVDTWCAPHVTAFGNASGATTLTLQVSQDGTNWYDSQVTQALAGAGDFCLNASVGARFVRLKSSNDVNVTATISAKD